MTYAGKTTHIGADLSENSSRADLLDAWNSAQALNLHRERGKLRLNALGSLNHRLLDIVKVSQQAAEQKGMMQVKAAGQRLPQRRQLVA